MFCEELFCQRSIFDPQRHTATCRIGQLLPDFVENFITKDFGGKKMRASTRICLKKITLQARVRLSWLRGRR
jgi:hypothetical protein